MIPSVRQCPPISRTGPRAKDGVRVGGHLAPFGEHSRYQRLFNSRGKPGRWLRRFAVLRHRWWTLVTGADIPLNCNLGGGLLLPHPNGIVIHPDAEIGPNCLLFHQVTIGEESGGVPTLVEGHVDVGAGAEIIGQLRIGKHAKIGANAVVLTDVPAGATAVGIPARIIRH